MRFTTMHLALAGWLLTAACDSPPPVPAKPAPTAYWVHVQGTVVHVQQNAGQPTYVVIETDDGQLFTVALTDAAPPVWPGLHGLFAYESASKEQGLWKNFIVQKRWNA